MKPVVSVIIVAYRNMECLAACLESINHDPGIEIIVVNNSHQNRGFGAGCNLGAAMSSAPVLLFLNPDSLASVESILCLAKTLQSDERIGMAGPALLDAKKKVVLSVSRQPEKHNFWIVYSFLNRVMHNSVLVRRHWYSHASPPALIQVGVVSGAAIAMRRSLFDTLNGFDESFFLYWEEVDLARRCLRKGYRVVFNPRVQLLHFGALSTPSQREQVMVWFRQSRFHFMRKHFGLAYAAVVEAWLGLTEHWPLTFSLVGLFILSFGVDFFMGAAAMAAVVMVYNELVVGWGRRAAGLVGYLCGVGVYLTSSSPVWLLVAGLVWIVIDLVPSLVHYRRIYVISLLLGLICLV